MSEKEFWVVPGIKGKVALWDKDPVYEEYGFEAGELWIAWGQGDRPAPVLVPATPAINAALRRGALEKVLPPEDGGQSSEPLSTAPARALAESEGIALSDVADFVGLVPGVKLGKTDVQEYLKGMEDA